MAWLTWLLFESFIALAALLFTVNFVLLVHWRRGGRPRPLLIGLLAGLVLLIVQALVVTRREHALAVLTPIEREVTENRTDALAAALAPQFHAGGMGPEAFVEFVERQFEKIRIRSVNRSGLRIADSAADSFTAVGQYQVDVTVHDFTAFLATAWEFQFVRTPQGWRLAELHARYIQGLPNPEWRTIDDY